MSNKADYFDILVDLARQEAAKAIENTRSRITPC